MGRLPPVTAAALAHATGIALPLAGLALPPALLLSALPPALLLLWRRPSPSTLAVVALLAGVLSGTGGHLADLRDCRLHLPDRWEGEVVGRFLAHPVPGRSLPFRVEEGLPGGCRGTVRASLPRPRTDGPSPDPPPVGVRIAVPVRWEGREVRTPGRGEWAGRLQLQESGVERPGGDLAGRFIGVRGRVQIRMARLWGPEAPVVEALVLARREHLDPELREAFALSGTAHLLAISGFHVGVVAGLLLGLLRLAGAPPRWAGALAAAGCWGYVLGIGAPHAAVRAALLLTLLAATRIRGWPVVPVGALSAALLLLLVVDPRYLASVGFQLSFAGTAGLVLLRTPTRRALEAGWRQVTGRPLPRGKDGDPGVFLLRGSSDGVVAGVAATLPTLPLLAWHFDRISLLGVPATLLAAPPVAAAIPGILGALLLSFLSEGAGRFLAGGVGLLLWGVGTLVRWVAELPGASFWVSRPALLAGGGGALLALGVLRRIGWGGRIGPPVRRAAAVGWGIVALLLLPLTPSTGALELHMLEVGQGDAMALRTPGGRWMVVDAGPRSPGYDAGARKVVPWLRRQGVTRLEALVLSHPHLDHIGGGEAVLTGVRVRGILDPSHPSPYPAYLALMEAARHREVWWWTAEAGRGFTLDGVEFRVLHPTAELRGAERVADANDLSVILLVRFGESTLLLTGDAGSRIEAALAPDLPRLTLLKAGHHGSRTSTSEHLLTVTRPEGVLIPVGEGNRFGHPHPEVTGRLETHGIPVWRTDRDGDIRVRLRRNGAWEVRTAR